MAKAKAGTAKLLTLTLVKSLSKRKPSHLANAKGLGLKRMHQTVQVQDTPENRGMIQQINYLLKVEEA